MFRPLDRVILKKALPLHNLYRGASGTITKVHPNSEGYEVEFNLANGKPALVVSLKSSVIRAAD